MFVGGLGGGEQTDPERVAEILCWELDQRAGDRLAGFSVRSVSVDGEVIHRIERVDAGVTKPVADLYCVALTDEGPSAVPLAAKRVLTLGLQVAAGIMIWVAAVVRSNRRAKSVPQKLQLLLCLLILLCLGVYFLTAVYALAEAVYTAAAGGGNTLHWPQWVVLATAVVGVLWPNARSKLTAAAEVYQRALRYLWTSGDRNRLTGRIQGLVDKINRRPEVQNIHLLGYSFGALAVLDTVYPTSSGRAGGMQQVRTIVTMGCPFDMVRMMRPSYARGRGTATDSAPRWVNVYAPLDLLASNFSDSNDVTDKATTGVRLVNHATRMPDVNLAWNRDLTLNAINFLMLRSLVVHAEYWDATPEARTALGEVMAELYRGTTVMR